jgi:hypothetical protein
MGIPPDLLTPSDTELQHHATGAAAWASCSRGGVNKRRNKTAARFAGGCEVFVTPFS